MAEHSSGNAAQTPIICLFCDKQNVDWKCNECGFLCNFCKDKKHSRLTSSHKHRLVSIEDLGKSPCYNEPWYHGQITRKEAVTLLQTHKYMGDGVFLVRDSQSEIGTFVIDVLVDNIARHGRIQPREVSGQLKFYFGKTSFDSIKEGIKFFKNNPMRLSYNSMNLSRNADVKLTMPISKDI